MQTNKTVIRLVAMILSILLCCNCGFTILAEEFSSASVYDPQPTTILASDGFGAALNAANEYDISYRATPPSAPDIDISELFNFIGDTGTDSNYSNIAVVADDTTYKYGAMWAKEKLDLTQPFETKMKLYLFHSEDGSNLPTDLADGMTFTLHNDARGAEAIGSDGEGLGVYGSKYYEDYSGSDNPVSVIERALSIEFDLYHNSYENQTTNDHYMNDPWYVSTYGHCALIYPKYPLDYVHIEASDHLNCFSFSKQSIWYDFSAKWVPSISTDGTVGGTLTYTFNDITTTVTIADVTEVFGGKEVYWGFTGATGGNSSVLAAAITELPRQNKLDIVKSVKNYNGDDLDNGYAREGDVLSYSIEVSAREVVSAIGPITITDELSPYVDYTVSSITVTTSDSSKPSFTVTPEFSDSTITVNTGHTLNNEGDWLRITFDVVVKEGSGGEIVYNTAMAGAANLPEPKESNTTKVTIPETPEKAVSEDSEAGKDGAEVAVGDKITYHIGYMNYEEESATVIITDKLPDGVDFISADNSGVYDKNAHTVTWTLEDISSGDSGYVSVAVEVNQNAVTKIVNGATVQVGDHDPQSSNKVENPVQLPFSDDHYAYIIGYAEDGTVRPKGNITRAETATIFFRLVTEEYRVKVWSKTNSYTDVKSTAWYNNAISTMSNAGILKGYPEGDFRPDGYITRAELAVIAARFVEGEYSGADKFSDISGHWAAKYINIAAEYGWVEGYPEGDFRPDEYITRAQVATLVNRVTGRTPETEDDLLSGMVKWPDNADPSEWYYVAIQEATNAHEYIRKADEYHEKWTALRVNRDWRELEK